MSLVNHSSILKNHRAALGNTIYFKEVGQHTYVPPEDLAFIVVEVQAGGGGSAGCPATNSTQYSMSSGAGGGGYGRKKWLLNELNLLGETVTVGDGGAAGLASGGSGSNGTDSIFKTSVAIGGVGSPRGLIASSGTQVALIYGGAGSGATGVDFEAQGSDGQLFWLYFGYCYSYINGGSSFLGGSSKGYENGKLYGGGAGGVSQTIGNSARVGKSGAQGIVIINEYF